MQKSMEILSNKNITILLNYNKWMNIPDPQGFTTKALGYH